MGASALRPARRPVDVRLRHPNASEELFDTEADPGEMQDVAAQHPLRAAYLRETLLEWVGSVFRPGADATAGPDSMSRDECEALKVLGYLSGDQACPES